MSVVAAFKFDEFLTPGIASGQTDGAHGSLGTGVDHAHHIHRGVGVNDHFRHADLNFRWSAVGVALSQRFIDAVVISIRSMAENQRPPGADIVRVFISIRVVDL